MYPSAEPTKSELTLKIVGSNTFGRNPKISPEQTFNMMVSDGWLVQTPGYKKVLELPIAGIGRGIYSSSRGGFMISVASNIVFRVSGPPESLVFQEIFRIDTSFGDISIDENIAYQIAICDKQNLWIYNWRSNAVVKATLPINTDTGLEITPGYVTYHDGYFIVPDITSAQWYLSAPNDGTNWLWGAGTVPVNAAIQTKPDDAVAILRAPGKGNLIYVFGENVTEMWYDNAGQLFPYQRSNSVSVDYGCLSSTTIAAMDEYVAFLGANEKSGPVIMISTGGGFTHLSTDGIDLRLEQLVNPSLSYAFFYKIDGHVFYQITFYDPRDNLSLLYDFNTKMFFYVTDENMNFHIAEAVAFYNNTYYFVSLRDGGIYELNSNYTQYDYTVPSRTIPNPNPEIIYEIPRMRICNNIRQIDASRFIANSLSFTVEQGVDPYYPTSEFYFATGEDGYVITQEERPGYIGYYLQQENTIASYVPRIDMSISKDGGQTFGSYISRPLNAQGNRKNRMIFWRMGAVNDLVVQFRFWSKYRVTVSDGVFSARVVEGERMQ